MANLLKFVQRFTQMQHSLPDAHEVAIIATFHANVKNSRMLKKMSTRSIKTITALFELADKVAHIEEVVLPINRNAGRRPAARAPSGKNQHPGEPGARKRVHQAVF